MGCESAITIHHPKLTYQMPAWRNEKHETQKKRVCRGSSGIKGTQRSVTTCPRSAEPGLLEGAVIPASSVRSFVKQQKWLVHFPVGVYCCRNGFNIPRLLASVLAFKLQQVLNCLLNLCWETEHRDEANNWQESQSFVSLWSLIKGYMEKSCLFKSLVSRFFLEGWGVIIRSSVFL